MAVLAATALLAAGGAVAAPAPVTPADDAYHLKAWADGRHDAFYTEWWYFNFIDAATGLKGIFTYFVLDPQQVSSSSLAQMAAVAYTPGGTVKAVDVYPADDFTASYEQAGVELHGNRIEVEGDGSYEITGHSRDSRLAWDLRYTSLEAPWFAADRMHVGHLAWEKMSWLVYMPAARVEGTLSVDGQLYTVQGNGYHDHNWGEWLLPDALWNWGQASQPGFSLELGDFIGGPPGLLAVDVDGRRRVFDKTQYSLLHLRWRRDDESGLRYPAESLLIAADATMLLRVKITATDTVPLRGDAPFPLPDPVIFEQTARYSGQVLMRDPGGGWRAPVDIEALGFREYTANAWR